MMEDGKKLSNLGGPSPSTILHGAGDALDDTTSGRPDPSAVSRVWSPLCGLQSTTNPGSSIPSPASGAPEVHRSPDPDSTVSAVARAPVRTHVPLQDPPADGWRPHILSPEMADLDCRALGAKGVLQLLNQVLSHELGTEILMSDPGVDELLKRLVEGDDAVDFGSLYGRVRGLWEQRHYWPTGKHTAIRPFHDVKKRYMLLVEYSNHIYKARKAAVSHNFINRRGANRSLPDWHAWPRRLWDLHAHRIVPYHFAFRWDYHEFNGYASYDAVSHSWTSTMLGGSGLSTAVNGHEWPVPLPHGVSLEAVRNELLHLGAEYVWLDVVCLRQQGSTREDLRAHEWAVDIPTIGDIYQSARRIVRYYNGLGIAFQCPGWTDERHWLRRVWTIQEIRKGSIIAGLPQGLTADMLPDVTNKSGKSFRSYLIPVEGLEHVGTVHSMSQLLRLAKELQSRHATKEIDKVAAFGALLDGLDYIPLYRADMNLEEAWRRLLQCMSRRLLDKLIWGYCRPGTGRCKWRPSWNQLMHEQLEYIDVGRILVPDRMCAEILNTGYASRGCYLLTGEAELSWECGDDQQAEGQVQYSDAVVHHLEFRIPGGSGQEHRSEETARLLANALRWNRMRAACVMVCREVRTPSGETGYEKIHVIATGDIDRLLEEAEREEITAIFI
ncbi:hypothetical protein OE88DRAFT_213795 [Heliocybe sulcata]|uniref:Heterokaryon incompatibility domain-containing protein n=1 Tax=Heliocybe sulcata TaxID=5364 RepID=A0A5C3N1Y5_9AGAM|nr:hypothetical protein OE88DRAFT_213795 [Heliocybe sulcata]